MEKIKMGKIVEMDGDEMTRIIWKMIKDIILFIFLEYNKRYNCGALSALISGSLTFSSDEAEINTSISFSANTPFCFSSFLYESSAAIRGIISFFNLSKDIINLSNQEILDNIF